LAKEAIDMANIPFTPSMVMPINQGKAIPAGKAASGPQDPVMAAQIQTPEVTPAGGQVADSRPTGIIGNQMMRKTQ
jgi:hypothetical protein